VSSFEHGEVTIVDSVDTETFVAGVYNPPLCSLKTFLEEFNLYCDYLVTLCHKKSQVSIGL
jgi:hypothetical protein